MSSETKEVSERPSTLHQEGGKSEMKMKLAFSQHHSAAVAEEFLAGKHMSHYLLSC